METMITDSQIIEATEEMLFWNLPMFKIYFDIEVNNKEYENYIRETTSNLIDEWSDYRKYMDISFSTDLKSYRLTDEELEKLIQERINEHRKKHKAIIYFLTPMYVIKPHPLT